MTSAGDRPAEASADARGRRDPAPIDARLVRRRQFILGPTAPVPRPGWRRVDVRGNRVLLAHPDLDTSQCATPRLELTLLGLMLDPDHPERSDGEILADLATRVGDAALLDALDRIGGRWALIVVTDRGAAMHLDACALRQAAWVATPQGVWVASEAGLLAEQLGLAVGPAERTFVRSLYYRSYPEAYWPGDATPFSGVRQLLPNHTLDLGRGIANRSWPRADRIPLPLDEALGRTESILRGIVRAAAVRYPLTVALTAGIDSRAVLAATRGITADITTFTFANPALGLSTEDERAAAQLSAIAGRSHMVVGCPDEASPAVKALQQASTTFPHARWSALVSGLREHTLDGRVALQGSASEVARFGYAELWRMDAAGLARTENMVRNSFARAIYERWLVELNHQQRWHGYDTLDLAYWEHRMGKWLAASHHELDTAIETLTPFNVRALFEALLSTDSRYRHPPGYVAHHRLVARLWPALMAVPVNQTSRLEYLSWRIRRQLSRALKLTIGFDTAKAAWLILREKRRRSSTQRRTEGEPARD